MNNHEEICPHCELTEAYTNALLEAEDEQEIRDIVSNLVDEAMILGVKDAVMTDIENKMQALKEIEQIMDCDGDCDDCNCH